MPRIRRVLALVLLTAGIAGADDVADQQRIDDLERRIEELEAEEPEATTGVLSRWTDYIRLGGYASTGFYEGRENSVWNDDRFEIWDVRFFVDVELGGPVTAGDTTLLRNAGFSFEWNLVRIGREFNEVGELYVEFQGIANSSWANLQFGRFQIPVGENYLRFSKGAKDNPFISNTAGGPWWWDEGFKFYGQSESGVFSYVASISEGESSFNTDLNSDLQYTLKLIGDPLPWLHVSLSGLYQGQIGDETGVGFGGALWLGETWARGFGAGSSVPIYIDGVLDTGPTPTHIEQTWLAGGDVIFDFPDVARIWFAYGAYQIDYGDSRYDRLLQYWIAEVVLDGGLIAPALTDVYLGLRANGLGTYDSNEGYLLDFRLADGAGYNMASLNAYQVVLGWRLLRHINLKLEYSHNDIDVVNGAPASIRSKGDRVDTYGFEVGVYF